ncbi:MAG: chitobiase/beta-hexosaminidase C-terminal domain-containing protein [Muribaculaceae bacterium]|nr:chitobiase/beta-hexosaminidase C-terminal domain-containing protein [Muribaculaceae bacterium]
MINTTLSKGIAGYRFAINDNNSYREITPPNTAEQQAYVLPSPEWKLPSLAEIAASLSFEETAVTMDCASEAEVMVQLHTQDGRWLAPIEETVRREAPVAEAAELRPFSTLALEKPAADSQTAFRIEMTQEATYWLRGSQDADVYVVREGAEAPGRWFTPAELRDGIQLDLTPGRWFGVMVNVPVNGTNPDSGIELRLNDTPGNMTPTPKINVSATDSSARVEISCTNPAAEIWYTLDGSAPERDAATRYESPFDVERNLTVQARAFTEDFEPSGIARAEISSFKAPRPRFDLQGYRLVMATDRANDSIYYTLDNTDPRDRTRATLYVGPFDLPQQSLMVRAVTVRDGWRDSDEESLEFNVNEHLVDMPRISRASDGRVVMECATAGASIRYTVDGSEPTAASTLYEGAITPSGNMTFKARAFKENMFVSGLATLTISDMTVGKPAARYEAHTIILTPADVADSILYVMDGDVTTAEVTVYTAPIPVENDCTVSFIGRREGWNDSPADEYRFTLADWKMSEPVFEADYRQGRLTVSGEADIRVSVDGEMRDAATAHTLTLTGETPVTGITALTPASDANHYDSESVSFAPEYEPAPEFSHDGLTLRVENVGECEILDSDTEVLKGTILGPLDLPRLFTLTARAVSDTRFPSAPTTFRSVAYYDAPRGEAGCLEEGYLAAGFAWTTAAHVTTLERIALTGATGEEDFDWIRTAMPSLREADLASLSATALPDRALAGMEMLESVTLPAGLTEGTPLFGENPRLTSLRLTGPIPAGTVASAANENLLVLTPDADWAPSDARLVAVGEGEDYAIEDLVLRNVSPFRTPVRLHARHAELTRRFMQETPDPLDPQPRARGWETISLPFEVQRVTHAELGEIKPFAAIEADDKDSRPFWLFRADSAEDWVRSPRIEAGVPYLISMPQHDNYLPQYRLGGEVTFSAENVTVTPADCEGGSEEWRTGRTFAATFMPLTEDELDGALTLNVGAEEGDTLPGSAFTDTAAPAPFTGYVTKLTQSESYLPVWPETSSAPLLADDDTLLIEPTENGVRLTSTRDREITVVTTTGLRLATLRLRPGESLTHPLDPGVYIIAGRKVAVN